ncbi:uncharacterized protein [Aegilops tauschii subsp. strangulata]|uniref:uncharacterized protein n=1 Tax=Aegilops tauschii subsp. strangulata TaxID=200361 RepID=UPI00098BB283|nr:uncharacterized protein LOC109782407 [Aegilops tauschii subsp. strangulata]
MEDTKPPDLEGMAEETDRFRMMELRSGRRARRSSQPCRARSLRSPCGGADDPLSALPDEMLLMVLARLRCARSAARTSILSRRWRGLWTYLPDLTFRGVAPVKIKAVLARLASSPSVPATLDIDIPPIHRTDDGCLGQLLDAVARISPRELLFSYQHDRFKKTELHLPCFRRALSIEIKSDNNICFTQLPAGEFSALERLSLRDAIVDIDTLLTHCPRLRVLNVVVPTSDIKVHSVSLRTIDVRSHLLRISSIDIVTPNLKQLELRIDGHTDLRVSISAPMVEKVVWRRYFSETSLLFGFWRLGSMDLGSADSFTDVPSVDHVLSLDICAIDQLYDYMDFAQEVQFSQEIENLPVSNLSVLELYIDTGGHVFGALVWRLFGLHHICAATTRLVIDIAPCHSKQPCPENCPCDEPKNWRCQSISLTRLEEAHIDGFSGEDHEHDFLELILRSSPMLNRVAVKLVPEFGGCTKKIYNAILAYPAVKGYVYFSSAELVLPPSD